MYDRETLRIEFDGLHTLLNVATDLSQRLRPLDNESTVEQLQTLLALMRDRAGVLHERASFAASLPSPHRQ